VVIVFFLWLSFSRLSEVLPGHSPVLPCCSPRPFLGRLSVLTFSVWALTRSSVRPLRQAFYASTRRTSTVWTSSSFACAT
jgi:hypothetical protein